MVYFFTCFYQNDLYANCPQMFRNVKDDLLLRLAERFTLQRAVAVSPLTW